MIRYKHTTKVSSDKTSAEISALLARAGATHIQQIIKEGHVSGVEFILRVAEKPMEFRVPIRSEEILARMELEYKQRGPGGRRLGEKEVARHIEKMREDSVRIAWRIALEWLKVQLSFIDTGARSPVEVFLADLILPGRDETMGQIVAQRGIAALLPAPKETRG